MKEKTLQLIPQKYKEKDPETIMPTNGKPRRNGCVFRNVQPTRTES